MRALPATIFIALVLAAGGCTVPHIAPQQARDLSRATSLVARAYRPIESETVSLRQQEWLVQGETVPVVLSMPGRGKGLPVVVFLPGLGESAQAGAVWRQAWARAGFAVLSVQPLEADASAWTSELARGGEFKALAQQRHAAVALNQRLERLTAVLAEARRRASAGDASLAAMDFSRMAVVGFDLGAQAAMALVGEHDPGSATPALAGQFRAAIILSPVVLAGQDRRERFDTVAHPVLSISSTEDADPTGLIATAALRTKPFELLPPGDKYLLVLDGASHARMSGQAEELREPVGQAKASRPSGGERSGRAEKGAKGRDCGQRGSTDQGEQKPTANSRALPAQSRHGKAEYDAAISAVSVAYLDAHLRERSAARLWLNEQVPAWLDGVGAWRQR